MTWLSRLVQWCRTLLTQVKLSGNGDSLTHFKMSGNDEPSARRGLPDDRIDSRRIFLLSHSPGDVGHGARKGRHCREVICPLHEVGSLPDSTVSAQTDHENILRSDLI